MQNERLEALIAECQELQRGPLCQAGNANRAADRAGKYLDKAMRRAYELGAAGPPKKERKPRKPRKGKD